MRSRQTFVLIAVKVAQHAGFRAPLIQALSAKGVKVFALAPDFDDVSREVVRALGAEPVDISLARTGMNPLTDVRDMFRLSRTLKRLKPDIVLSCFIKPVIFGTLAAWLARAPRRFAMIEGLGYVYTDNGDATDFKLHGLRALVSALYRFALKRAHRVIFLNPDDLNDFSRCRIVDSSKSVVLGGIGVDLDEWPFTPPVTDPVRFLFIGRLLREKGIEQFVAVARRVKERYSSAECVVLGDVDSNPGGVQAKQMQTWVDAGLIIWPGHVAVPTWLARSSVFVLPSFREGVPRSTQEAMAMGRPIITTDVPGCRDTVDDGVNGYLVPVRDDKALADAMIRFIEKPELIVSMGRESRRLAEQRFNVHEVNQRLMAILGL